MTLLTEAYRKIRQDGNPELVVADTVFRSSLHPDCKRIHLIVKNHGKLLSGTSARSFSPTARSLLSACLLIDANACAFAIFIVGRVRNADSESQKRKFKEDMSSTLAGLLARVKGKKIQSICMTLAVFLFLTWPF